MCLAWLRSVKSQDRLTEPELMAATIRNADGFGFVYADRGELVVRRYGPDELSRFRAEYARMEATGVPFLAHARFATHGAKVAGNAHPFVYRDPEGMEVAVVHNGMIDIKTAKGESDTANFVRLVLARLPARWWDDAALKYLVETSLGDDNKLALMTAAGEIVVLNEDCGTTRGDLWLSNTYSIAPMFTGNVTGTPKGDRSLTPAAPKQLSAISGTSTGNVSPSATRTHGRQKARERRAGRRARESQPVPVKPATATSVKPVLVIKARPVKPYQRLVIPRVPSVPVPSKPFTSLVHAGHPATVLAEGVRRDRDADFLNGVRCDRCGTTGDLFIVDGRAYVDGLAHNAASLFAMPF